MDEKNQTHKYGISMFHQLHCLGILRGAFQMLHESTDSHQPDLRETRIHRRDDEIHRSASAHELHYNQDHWTHCFDYLRQAILCNADGTIEPPKVNTDGHEIVDGMVERQCKDWGILYLASEQSGDNSGMAMGGHDG
ncbi:hypothetical protein LX36DRAFT_585453 [Colletotrichum falcatum]|nr:hypothetical protein LX36DRAFT_585453 [Colletotrichum falcatum]